MKQLIQDGIEKAKMGNKKVGDITTERRDDELSEAFKKANIDKEKGIELRKHVKIIKNKEISFERNYKKFRLNWRNDKRVIDVASKNFNFRIWV